MIIFACALLLSANTASAMTVAEAVEAALKNNPDIQSVRLEQGAAQGRLDQAGLWLRSNPVIEGSLSRKDTVPGGGEKVTNKGLSLSQEFEIAGQRGLRVAAARNGMEKASQDIRDRHRILVAEVKDSFAKALATKRKVELADEAVRLQEQFVSSATVKYQAGEISQLEQNLADVELGKARRERLLAEKERREALLDLQMLLGLTPKTDFSVEGDLPMEAPAIPDKEKLRTLAAAQRPDVLSTAAEVQQARSAMKLAGRGDTELHRDGV
jgi:cobalt-zinc-cadmium efflux system outer membrane protein